MTKNCRVPDPGACRPEQKIDKEQELHRYLIKMVLMFSQRIIGGSASMTGRSDLVLEIKARSSEQGTFEQIPNEHTGVSE